MKASQNKILVTDSLFIKDKHVQKLEQAGFIVERLDKPDASEEELCQALKGKVGYLLGGIERVTKKVIDASDRLKVISLLGIGYQWFIPAWKYAINKGVVITNTPQGPTQEVAEWAITACLMMNREFLDLGRLGEKKFAVTKGIEGQDVGIIGLGNIGTRTAEMLKVFLPKSINYFSRSRSIDKENSLGLNFLELSQLLSRCDIVFLCVSDEAQGLITSKELIIMKKNALLVSITHPGIIKEDDLLLALQQKNIRAISDYPMSLSEFNKLPPSRWFCMNSSNTITEAGVELMSNTAVESIINILKTGSDKFRVEG